MPGKRAERNDLRWHRYILIVVQGEASAVEACCIEHFPILRLRFTPIRMPGKRAERNDLR